DAALQVLEKDPGHEEALVLAASAAIAANEAEETRKLVERLAERQPDRAGYHLARGMFKLRQEDETGAESEFRAALRLDPKSAAAYSFLATLYWGRNDLKSAEQAFKIAAELAPLRSPIRLRYVDFKLRTGAAAEAKTFLEAITQQAPDYLPPRV